MVQNNGCLFTIASFLSGKVRCGYPNLVACKVLLYHLQVLHGAITTYKVDDSSCFPKQHRTANPVGCIHSDHFVYSCYCDPLSSNRLKWHTLSKTFIAPLSFKLVLLLQKRYYFVRVLQCSNSLVPMPTLSFFAVQFAFNIIHVGSVMD